MTERSLQEQLADLWRTRPARLPGQGHIAGVCGGVGHRYGVDPVLVRVAFVVATVFGGSGIVLYLAAWLVLPRTGDDSSAAEALVGRGHSSDSGTRTVVLLVALVVALSTLGPAGIGLGGSGMVGLLLMLAGWWLLYQRQPVAPSLPHETTPPVAGTYPPVPGTFGSPFTTYGPYVRLPESYTPEPAPDREQRAGTDGAPSTSGTATAPANSTASPNSMEHPEPPSWDPLGVAPFAWDLPTPAPDLTPDVQPKQRSRITPLFLGLAIIAAAAASAIAVATDAEWLTPARIGAVALAVVGLGLVVGAFVRRGHGLLVVTGPLAGFVILASLVGPIDFDTSHMGEQRWAPTTTAALQGDYRSTFGSAELDLRGLTLTEDRTVAVENRFGEVIVYVPDGMNVANHCDSAFGEAQCLPDTPPGDGPLLTLDIENQFGNVEVHRG
ncbi:PspC domain-containing protein [Rhodococcus sp. HNM0569]|uniref:PspC domain-containing protein n=1 Tax=Rhodococcus sp. HNM0569 TaxID=2716340 RepID=UPI00146C3AE4|nr:PspC domain-containing protein [Rhodococcus sp. HNM0569]NLU81797.1 PspC domain-containing protein [Rhodococcus sp. HNM0569]